MNNLLVIKARRKGNTVTHFKQTLIELKIMEDYKFIIIDMFVTPSFVLDEDTGLPKNFDTYEEAKEYSKTIKEPLIIDIKKLQYENKVDDIAADMSW